MAATPAVLVPGATLGTSAAAIYTAPGSTKAVVKRGVFANGSASATTYTVTLTRSGGSPLALIPARSVAAGATDVPAELANLVLNAGDALNAQAGAASSIVATVSGFTV